MQLSNRAADCARVGRLQAVAAAVVATCLALHGAACDTTAKFRIDEVRFDPEAPLVVVSATPLQSIDASGGVPACSAGDAIRGFRLDLILRSTAHEGALTGNRDLQVRDGDRVAGIRIATGETLSHQNFEIGQGDLLTEVSSRSTGNNQQFPSASARSSALTFEARNTRRSDPIAVAVIVDHSGSMRGLVDPNRHYEVRTNQLGVQGAAMRSDPSRERFLKMGSDFIALLNQQDRLIAWFINDRGVNLACAAPELDGPLFGAERIEQERFCFQPTQRQHIYAPGNPNSAFSRLQSGSGTVNGVDVLEVGRTPLWTAVNHAYSFLQNEAPADMAKHIVVLTDGPDTCDMNGPYWVPDEGCPTGAPSIQSTGFAEFKERLELQAAVGKPIPVSFLQLQSYGYNDPDPAQQEISCLSGGSYQWLHTDNLQRGGEQFGREIQRRVQRMRYTLGAVWRLAVEAEGSLTQFTANAQQILLDGTLTLFPRSVLPLPSQYTVQFRSATVDERLLLRRTCTGEADCGGVEGDCVQDCLAAGDVCGGNVGPDRAAPWNVDEPGCCCGADAEVAQCTAVREPCCVVGPQHQLCQPQLP